MPTKADDACEDVGLNSDPDGVRSCSGEPYHDEFFEKSTFHFATTLFEALDVNFAYLKRHRVLFNLYAFDSVRSNLTHAPTLNLINCDFKYFHDKQALI